MTAVPDWLESGYQHIWLPYAQMKTAPVPLPVIGAADCELHLADGRTLIDGIASWWSMCHGYQHPHIVDAIATQASTLSHVMFAGLAHEPAYRLATRLAAIAPDGLERVFFCDSGSIAVEVAMKMAIQYWLNLGQPKKDKFICFHHAYHGDTLGTMSISPRSGIHQAFDKLTYRNYALDLPSDEYSMAEFTEMLQGIAPTVAGLVMEPLVQGAGGMRFHSADIVAEVRRVCREHNILFIADEIMTGFARTGSLFACDEAGITPDILCVGKGLTGGHMSLAATLATTKIFDAFLADDTSKALMHGPTFMANPLACAAANASLDLFEQEPRLAQVEAIEQQLNHLLAPCRQIASVQEVRVKGAIGVVQIEATQADMFLLRPQFVEEGVWLRPFGNVIYVMPPLTIRASQLEKISHSIVKIVSRWSAQRSAS